jgi:hypothetical protein
VALSEVPFAAHSVVSHTRAKHLLVAAPADPRADASLNVEAPRLAPVPRANQTPASRPDRCVDAPGLRSKARGIQVMRETLATALAACKHLPAGRQRHACAGLPVVERSNQHPDTNAAVGGCRNRTTAVTNPCPPPMPAR